ncbi:hypothetical protein GW756_03060 [bacterium]|nr:hypothetical protein [bacterium]NCQ55502.1 hypothetical protein [Candidatus Parcubacteria bacterium]NCS67513.1 hypothetical protein [Candidatus Peregrinibacteria bacterium]NCS96322.1 hypothetical protein [bacterium]
MKRREQLEKTRVEFSDSFKEDLKEPFRLVFPTATAEAILLQSEKIDLLKYSFNEVNWPEPLTEEKIILFVETKFRAYINLLREHAQAREIEGFRQRVENDRRHQDLVLLCWVAGTITPILDGDWSIGRVAEIEEILGIDSFIELQEALTLEKNLHSPNSDTKSLGSFNHLHLGPGDGSFMQHLRDKAPAEISRAWREIGLGYALHHAPTEILSQFLKDGLSLQESAFVEEVLMPGLRSALQKKWFDRHGEQWTPKPGVRFDNNDIYKILTQPAQWLDAEARIVEISTEYENDAKTHITPEAYETGLRYLGLYSDAQIAKKRLIFEASYWDFRASDSCLSANRISKNQLHHERRRIKRAKSQEDLKDLTITPEVFKEDPFLTTLKDDIKKVNQALNEERKSAEPSEKKLAEYRDQLKDFGEQVKHRRTEVLSNLQTQFSVAQLQSLRTLFKPEFIIALEQFMQSDSNRLNLNRYIKANPHNFVAGTFVDLPDLIPDLQFDLITDIRSASHENDTDFELDIINRCIKAEPGAIIFGDGFKQSYSRVMRLIHMHRGIASAEEDLNKKSLFRAYVCMDAETHRPKNVVIQKQHEDGTFTIDNPESLLRSRFANSDTYLKPLDDFVAQEKDPIATQVELLNWARRVALRLTKEGREKNILNGEHDRIKEMVAGLLPNLEDFSKDEISLQEDLLPAQLHELQLLVTKEVARLMDKNRHRIGWVVALPNGGLELYAGNKLDSYPNPALQLDAKTNRHYALKMEEVPDMSHFERPEVVEALETKKRRLKGLLQLIQKSGIDSPLVVVNFSDCVTNTILWERLQALVGTNFAQEAVIDFKSDDHSKAQAKLKRYEENGGILVGGGSWENVDEAVGAQAKKLLMPLMKLLLTANSRHTALGICFSYQIMADLIGKEISPTTMNSVSIEAGMFEFGAIPISRGKDLQNSSLYADCPRHFSIAHTHGRHLVDRRVGNQFSSTQHLLAPAATSLLTKQPVGFISNVPGILNRGSVTSIIGFQGHPEVRLNTHDDTKRVEAQLVPAEPWLRDSFGIDIRTLNKGFDQFTERAKRLGHTQEAGDHLLVNSLIMLAEGLLTKIRVSSTL